MRLNNCNKSNAPLFYTVIQFCINTCWIVMLTHGFTLHTLQVSRNFFLPENSKLIFVVPQLIRIQNSR